jgi:hypothetical protein
MAVDKTHRTFHYDPDTGRSTPVEEIELPNGDRALIPIQLNEKGEKTDDFSEKSNSSRPPDISSEQT